LIDNLISIVFLKVMFEAIPGIDGQDEAHVRQGSLHFAEKEEQFWIVPQFAPPHYDVSTTRCPSVL
jgi:hypothetical protein